MMSARNRMVFLALSMLLTITAMAAAPVAALDHNVPIVIKINRIQETLNLIDELAKQPGQPAGPSPTAMLRGMMQGTDWIDPGRAIVIGVDTAGEKPQMTALIPFQNANEAFRGAFNAQARDDYYLMAIPPGQPMTSGSQMEKTLVAASRDLAGGVLSLKLAVGPLLQQNQDKIQQAMLKLDAKPRQPQAGGLDMSPADIKDMINSLLVTAEQLDTIGFDLDMSQQQVSFGFEATALADTELASLFVQGGATTRLSAFEPDLPITFRSRSYPVKGMIDLIDTHFGNFYKKLGFDFKQVAELANQFSGEMVGGSSLSKEGAEYEMVAVLNSDGQKTRFIEARLLPWMKTYIANLNQMMTRAGAQVPQATFQRTDNSTVAGHEVFGYQVRMPLMAAGPSAGHLAGPAQWLTYDSRVAAVGDLLVIAPNDNRMAQMIDLAASAKAQPAGPHLMSFSVDMKSYLAFMLDALGDWPEKPTQLPDLGPMVTHVQSADGRIRSQTMMGLDDLKSFIALSAQLKKATAQRSAAAPARPIQSAVKPAKPVAVSKTAPVDELAQKGALFATYGNHQAAIGQFKKALAIEPGRSDIQFSLGLSYGETGQFEAALNAMDRAIAAEPDNGVYHYGKARVLLISGQTEQAVNSFKTAADLGDPDARAYLDTIARRTIP